jgi:hypothetical protein
MAASERAQRLIRAFGYAIVDAGGKFNWAGTGTPNDERAALLAYVAALEACVDAARRSTNAREDPHVLKALAALDRPEDGESK